MNDLLDILLCGFVVFFEIFAVFTTTMLIQLIFYRVFKINLFKLIIKGSNKLDKYLNEMFY